MFKYRYRIYLMGYIRSSYKFLKRKFSKMVYTTKLLIIYLTIVILCVRFVRFKSPISCYRHKLESLPDISEVSPEKGQSIFFIETSCTSFDNRKITINARQACAVESAAKINPNREVYLLFAAPGLIKLENTSSDRYLQALMSYKNIKLHHVDYEKYINNTPVESLYVNRKIQRSSYAISHASDVIRYLTLYKYGGIYLDLDVIVVKSFDNLPKNFAGIEVGTDIAAGVIGFNHEGVGHVMASYCLNILKHEFNGESWSRNGPGTIKRFFEEICVSKNRVREMENKECNGFTAFSPSYFYPIPYLEWTKYFEEEYLNEVIKTSNETYVHHVWNKFSAKTKIKLNKISAYLMLAEKYCPKVYTELEEYF